MSEPFARPGTTLCIVSLTYGADLDAIDAAMADHVDWLRACYAEGRLIASGRKSIGLALQQLLERTKQKYLATLQFLHRQTWCVQLSRLRYFLQLTR